MLLSLPSSATGPLLESALQSFFQLSGRQANVRNGVLNLALQLQSNKHRDGEVTKQRQRKTKTSRDVRWLGLLCE